MFLYLVFFGATLQFLGGLAYIKGTLRGETKPNRVTWFLWAVAPFIGTAAALSDGVGWAILPVFMAGFVPMLVFISSFVNKNAYWKLGRFDYTCGAFSVLALILWVITQQPIVAILFAIIADGFAALPTLVKSWSYPETESPWVYAATVFSSFAGLLVIQIWIFSEYAFPLYLIVINLVILLSIYRSKIIPKR